MSIELTDAVKTKVLEDQNKMYAQSRIPISLVKLVQDNKISIEEGSEPGYNYKYVPVSDAP